MLRHTQSNLKSMSDMIIPRTQRATSRSSIRPKRPLTQSNTHPIPPPSPLQPRINLINNRSTSPRSPRITKRINLTRRLDQARDISRPLKHIQVQTTRDMPRDVAMKRPNTGIISLDLNSDVAIRTHHLHISSSRVAFVTLGRAIPCPCAFG